MPTLIWTDCDTVKVEFTINADALKTAIEAVPEGMDTPLEIKLTDALESVIGAGSVSGIVTTPSWDK